MLLKATRPIYSNRALRDVVRWVKSDGRLYTEDELLGEVRLVSVSRSGGVG